MATAAPVGVATGVMKPLLTKLTLLLEEEYAKLKGVRKQIKFLRDKLHAMSVTLDMLADAEELDPETRDWRDKLLALAYDLEDLVDAFVYRAVDHKREHLGFINGFLRMLKKLKLGHEIANQIQELKASVMEASEWHKRYDLSQLINKSSSSSVDPRLHAFYEDVDNLVGIDAPKKHIIELLNMEMNGSSTQLKVVSISGCGGLGKTTLAKQVYGDIENQFKCAAFVSVSRTLDVKGFLKHIADRVKCTSIDTKDDYEQQSIDKLREHLHDKRYFIVIDDLWSSKDWRFIKFCFPDNSLGSRIITTTRNLALAMECSRSSDCIYNIGLLNEVHSKKLILDRAFGTGRGCPQYLEDVLAQITRRCSGLPLALVTVPSMLQDKFSKDEWERLIASRWLSRPDAKVMKQIFNHSYYDLPHHLRACLLDVSMFPEDFKVDVDRLVRRWIAEGYISEVSEGVEETARRWINDLISRNMVQPLPLAHGAPRCCRLHPVIHDFLICKSMEENFVSLVDDQNPPTSSNCTVYPRLSVQSSKHDQDLTSYDGMELSHVRSITVFGQASSAPRLTNLRVVRVLDLEGCVGPVCLDDLDKLPLLRYLSLKGTDVAELPAALWELRFLESLDVRSTKVKQLPPSIVGLRHSLRTLLFGHEGMINSVETATRVAENIHDCRRLENVATIDSRVHPASFVKALGDLSDLRMLKITWYFHQCTEGAYCEALLSSMMKWSQLRSLTIHCGLGCCMGFLDSLSHPPELLEKFKVRAGGFVSVPKWIQRLKYLSSLQITICKIETNDLKILRGIPKLQSLILGLDFVPRETLLIESEGFSNLLWFSVNCPAPWLTFPADAMPKLTYLQLEFCSGSTNPESVPSGISNLQRLTEVVLLYNQKWCADSSSIRMTVDAVKRQVAKHRNLIDLIINNAKVDVQEVDEEMKSTTEIQSGDAGEETARTTVETTQGEIEIKGECDDISSTY